MVGGGWQNTPFQALKSPQLPCTTESPTSNSSLCTDSLSGSKPSSQEALPALGAHNTADAAQ